MRLCHQVNEAGNRRCWLQSRLAGWQGEQLEEMARCVGRPADRQQLLL